MKKKYKYTAIIIASIFALTVFHFVSRDKDVFISSSDWDCKYINKTWECQVSLEIENETNIHQHRNISIRGNIIPHDSKFSTIKNCGEKYIKIEIAPNDKISFTEVVEMDCKPNKVNMKIWK